jgi:hypothetical protein
MKKKYFIVFLVFCFLVLSVVLRNSFFAFLIKNSFKKIFPSSAVSLKSLNVMPTYLDVRELKIQSGPRASLNINLSRINVHLKFSFIRFFFDKFFGINNGRVTFESGTCAGGEFKGFLLLIFRDDFFKSMDLSGIVENVSFQKIKVKDIIWKARLWRDKALVQQIDIDIFGGHAQGSGEVSFGKGEWSLSLTLVFKDINIADLMKALGAEERLKMSGFYTGPVRLIARNGQIEELTGNLDSRGSGEMIIRDTSLLGQNGIQKEAANIVVENLKNYYYDIGNIKIRNIGQDIKIDISLKGQTGERNLRVVWHGASIKVDKDGEK